MSGLEIQLNRDRPRAIDAPASFVADGPFDVALSNHGEGAHVHLALDDSLARVARLRDGSRFVEAGSTVRVGVDTRSVERPVTGALTVSTGYGAETETIELRIEPAGVGIEVDEGLAEPTVEEDESLDAETAGVLGLAAAAIVAAAAVALLVESPALVAAAATVALVTVVAVVVALT